MKYIRTEDGVYVFEDFKETRGKRCLNHYGFQDKNGICILGTLQDWKCYKKAENIEELCDTKVAIRKNNHKAYLGHFNGTYFFQEDSGWLGRVDSYEIIYGAIWTDKGLKYVAKMNDKGDLELI